MAHRWSWTLGASCSIHGRHSLEAQPGHHLAPQLLSSGRNVFEALGTGFTLLAFGAEPRSVAAFESVAKTLGIPLKLVSDTWDDDRRAYESRLVLVRPDQYVAWKGDTEPNELEAVLVPPPALRDLQSDRGVLEGAFEALCRRGLALPDGS